MKNKIIALVVLGGLLGAWFYYDWKKGPGVLVRPQEETVQVVGVPVGAYFAELVTDSEAVGDEKVVSGYSLTIRNSENVVVEVLPIPFTDEEAVKNFNPAPEAQDANFDGHADLRIQTVWGASNFAWAYWLYNPVTGTFELNETLSEAGNPELDVEAKQFKSHWKSGCAGACFNEAVYAFDAQGAPYLVREVTQDYKNENFDVFVRTTRELRDGVMTTVSTEEVRYDQ